MDETTKRIEQIAYDLFKKHSEDVLLREEKVFPVLPPGAIGMLIMEDKQFRRFRFNVEGFWQEFLTIFAGEFILLNDNFKQVGKIAAANALVIALRNSELYKSYTDVDFQLVATYLAYRNEENLISEQELVKRTMQDFNVAEFETKSALKSLIKKKIFLKDGIMLEIIEPIHCDYSKTI